MLGPARQPPGAAAREPQIPAAGLLDPARAGLGPARNVSAAARPERRGPRRLMPDRRHRDRRRTFGLPPFMTGERRIGRDRRIRGADRRLGADRRHRVANGELPSIASARVVFIVQAVTVALVVLGTVLVALGLLY